MSKNADTKPDARAADRDEPSPGARMPYQSPVLVEYGSIAKLTRGTRSVSSDAPAAGHKSMACL
jgi:hypothetical protein